MAHKESRGPVKGLCERLDGAVRRSLRDGERHNTIVMARDYPSALAGYLETRRVRD